ncbi:syntaxin-6 isoform X1 [Balaenoptera musculus]|uniref:Syntaxin-6 isoform X1 n=1 Tax=Balaenoptera musculus TaxID=9771 RepID=A0A8B8ZA63_BALMU|nr:syntaxin-6 isoform X1 [Balaenoptera musculus]
MSMEDPFFVVKGEVQKAVNTAQGLFQRWTELLQDPSTATREEIDWTTNELRNNLRSIEWDLEDLDETISIVEANPRKFNLDATELSIRKAFITSTRQVVRDMKDQMSTSSVQALAERKNRQALLGDSGGQNWSTGTMDKYGRLDRELQLANSHFIEEQQAQQQLIVEQQDEQLELVSGSIGVLKNMSQRIGGELEEQAVMLDDFSHELESTQSRLDNVMKKLAKVSHMTSVRNANQPQLTAPLRPRRSDPWLLEHGLWQGGTSTSHVPCVRGALRDIQQPTAAAGAGHQLGRTGKSLHQPAPVSNCLISISSGCSVGNPSKA